MAERLSRMYGTEEDKVNCPFFHKIGACRHGDRCSRVHNKPLFSQCINLTHMYINPMANVVTGGGKLSREQEREIQDSFEDFYQDVFEEVAKYGEVEDLIVLDNLGDHLIGNVYVKYYQEEDAMKALQALSGRWYSGRQINAEYSIVTEFGEASCRQVTEGGCSRGPWCNFHHQRICARDIKDELFAKQPHRGESTGAAGGGGDRDRRRSPSPPPRDRDYRDGGGRRSRSRDRGDRYAPPPPVRGRGGDDRGYDRGGADRDLPPRSRSPPRGRGGSPERRRY